MKRLHIHVGVENLTASIRFYSALFGVEPVKTKVDYAKWMLEDPRVNFAISTRVAKTSVDHFGIQVDDKAELDGLRAQFEQADLSASHEGETVCCYARSDKSWVNDPNGIAWEAYHTMEDAELFSGTPATSTDEGACCAPVPPESTACCTPSAGKTVCC
jgi:catechol 2,3-dioxygenase-like lactoylglutathione lyase family enzyme